MGVRDTWEHVICGKIWYLQIHQVVGCINSSFLILNSTPFYSCTNFIHLSVKKHLG